MKLICLMPARNEDWVLGLSARAALMWCDYLVVMLHRSVDESENLLHSVIQETDEDCGPGPGSGRLVKRRVIVLKDEGRHWQEMRLRQELLEVGRKLGGTHFALVDADEVLTGDLLPRIRRLVEHTEPGSILMLPWLCMKCEYDPEPSAQIPNLVMSSGMWNEQRASTAFPDNPVYHWAARATYDFHHRHPMGRDLQWYSPIEDRSSGLMHLQFASRRRLLAKQFLYQLIEVTRWPGRRPVSEVRDMYARTVNEAASASVERVPASWWAPYSHLMQYLHVDSEPWQEKECQRIIRENPGITAGLDHFGLMKEWGLEVTR